MLLKPIQVSVYISIVCLFIAEEHIQFWNKRVLLYRVNEVFSGRPVLGNILLIGWFEFLPSFNGSLIAFLIKYSHFGYFTILCWSFP